MEEEIGFMRLALEEARSAFDEGEVPVGAVLVKDGMVLHRAHNLKETLKDPSAHAEMLVLRACSAFVDNWRLTGATLYVTKEPCIMCAGVILHSRVARLVYGCKDPKGGGVDSLYHILTDERLNHRVEVVSGILEEDCASILRQFFRGRRQRKSG